MKISIITFKALNIEHQNINMNLALQLLINAADMSQFFLSNFCIFALTHFCPFFVVLSEISSIALLNLQMMMIKQLNSAFSESFTIKSIATVWNGSDNVIIELSLLYCWCLQTWSLWQSEQYFIYCWIYLIIWCI